MVVRWSGKGVNKYLCIGDEETAAVAPSSLHATGPSHAQAHKKSAACPLAHHTAWDAETAPVQSLGRRDGRLREFRSESGSPSVTRCPAADRAQASMLPGLVLVPGPTPRPTRVPPATRGTRRARRGPDDVGGWRRFAGPDIADIVSVSREHEHEHAGCTSTARRSAAGGRGCCDCGGLLAGARSYDRLQDGAAHCASRVSTTDGVQGSQGSVFSVAASQISVRCCRRPGESC